MVQLLKERKEELKILARENERLTAEIETYAVDFIRVHGGAGYGTLTKPRGCDQGLEGME